MPKAIAFAAFAAAVWALPLLGTSMAASEHYWDAREPSGHYWDAREPSGHYWDARNVPYYGSSDPEKRSTASDDRATTADSGVPSFDYEAHCADIASFGSGHNYQMEQRCLDAQEEALSELRGMNVPIEVRQHCQDISTFGVGGNYEMYLRCVRGQMEARGRLTASDDRATTADSGVPSFDYEAHCADIASFGGGHNYQMEQRCLDAQEQALSELRGMRVPTGIREHCQDISTFGVGGNYEMYLRCIRDQMEAREGMGR